MTTFFIFLSVVLFVLILVFSGVLVKKDYGTLIVISMVLLMVGSIMGATYSATYVKPFTGSGKIVVLDEVDARSSRSSSIVGKTITSSTRTIPKCYSVTIIPDAGGEHIRSLCVPYSQWKELSVDSLVEFGYDKDRHPYWGNYVIGDNEPKKSSNKKFKQYCEYVEDKRTGGDLKCDMIPESEYNRRTSEEAIKDIKKEDFRERQQEFMNWKEENFGK